MCGEIQRILRQIDDAGEGGKGGGCDGENHGGGPTFSNAHSALASHVTFTHLHKHLILERRVQLLVIHFPHEPRLRQKGGNVAHLRQLLLLNAVDNQTNLAVRLVHKLLERLEREHPSVHHLVTLRQPQRPHLFDHTCQRRQVLALLQQLATSLASHDVVEEFDGGLRGAVGLREEVEKEHEEHVLGVALKELNAQLTQLHGVDRSVGVPRSGCARGVASLPQVRGREQESTSDRNALLNHLEQRLVQLTVVLRRVEDEDARKIVGAYGWENEGGGEELSNALREARIARVTLDVVQPQNGGVVLHLEGKPEVGGRCQRRTDDRAYVVAHRSSEVARRQLLLERHQPANRLHRLEKVERGGIEPESLPVQVHLALLLAERLRHLLRLLAHLLAHRNTCQRRRNRRSVHHALLQLSDRVLGADHLLNQLQSQVFHLKRSDGLCGHVKTLLELLERICEGGIAFL